jgi:hypothetical protein
MRRVIIYCFVFLCAVVLLSCKKDDAPKQAETAVVEQVAAKTEQTEATDAKGAVKVEAASAAHGHDHPHSHDAEEDEDEEEEEIDEDKLKDNPLKLVGAEKIVVEEVNEMTEKPIDFELVNDSQEEVFFKRVRSSCSCLEVVECPDPKAVKPGEKIVIKTMLHGSSFGQSGTYPRALFIECRGCRELSVPITVIAKCIINVEPSAKINLGTFEGVDVNWVRQVTIHIRDMEKIPNLELKLPPENPRFLYNLVKVKGQDAYRFEIRPRLPMPRGQIQEIIFIPTIGIGKDNGVRLIVRGEVTGMKVDLSASRIWVKEEELLEKKQAEVALKVERSDKVAQKPDQVQMFTMGMRTRLPSYQEQQRKDVEQGANLIREEEEAVHKQGVRDTWEKISKELTLEAPEWIQVKPEVQDKGLVYKLVVSDEILNQPNRRVILTLKSGDHPFRKVELRVLAKQQ